MRGYLYILYSRVRFVFKFDLRVRGVGIGLGSVRGCILFFFGKVGLGFC